MRVSQFTRYCGGNPEEVVAIATQAKAIWVKHGAEEARLVRFHTGQWTGQWLFVVRCQDWTQFAKAQDGVAGDPEFQKLMTQVASIAKLEGRNVLMGYDI